jgi:hypothetical protein
MKRILLALLLLLPASLGCKSTPCVPCGVDFCDVPKNYRCVPEKKPIKHVIYKCKQVPYCPHQLPRLGDCSCCPQCQACPCYITVLMKQEVECGCTWDCVPQEIPCGCASVTECPTTAPASPLEAMPMPPPGPASLQKWLPSSPHE